MDLFDLAILALRVALVVVLYVFLALVVRGAVRALRTSPRAEVGGVLRLVVLESGATNLKTGQLVVLHDGATLGRSETAGLALADPAVSAEHAQLVRRHGAWVVLDLGSTNGTLVNHELVDGQAGLQSGDVLGLGNVRLKVVGP
jgi:hypothetical protein